MKQAAWWGATTSFGVKKIETIPITKVMPPKI